jgi:hypothetical protein
MNCPAEWIEHVNRPQTEAEEKAFREAMARGEPFGEESWAQAVKERMGVSRRSPRGRRMKLRDDDCPQQMTPDPLTNTLPLAHR